MTVVNPKSISCITSITTASGSDNLLTIHTSDANNTERLRIDSTGATKIVTGIVTTLTATTGIVTTLTANTVTSLGGVTASGASTFNEDVVFVGVSEDLRFDKSANALEFNDNFKSVFGNSGDLEIYHSGTFNRNYIQTTGTNHDLTIAADEIALTNSAASETSGKFISDGAVELYYNNIKKVETHAQGAAIASAGMTIPTMNSFSCQLLAGASGFLGNYHDGTTNQQVILGLNQYFDSAYKAPTDAVAAHLQIYQRTFRFNTAPAPGSAGGTLSHTQALRIDTDGIKFGTDSAAANALDDYEEGTWTPTVNGTNSNLTHRASRYLKIGKLVQLQVEFYTAAGNFSTGANLNLTNLPFQGPPSPMHVVGSVAYMNNAYGMTLMTNYMNASSQWYFSQATGSGLYLWANIAYETAS